MPSRQTQQASALVIPEPPVQKVADQPAQTEQSRQEPVVEQDKPAAPTESEAPAKQAGVPSFLNLPRREEKKPAAKRPSWPGGIDLASLGIR